jgi:hypothetical protein
MTKEWLLMEEFDSIVQIQAESFRIWNSRTLAIHLHVKLQQIVFLLQTWFWLSLAATWLFWLILNAPVPTALACGVMIFAIVIPAMILITFLHEIGHYIACRLAGTNEQCVLVQSFAGQCCLTHKQFESTFARIFVAAGGPFVNFLVAYLMLQDGNLWCQLLGWGSFYMGAESLAPFSHQIGDDEWMSDGTLIMANICDWLANRCLEEAAEAFSVTWFIGAIGLTVYAVYGFLDVVIKLVVAATTM